MSGFALALERLTVLTPNREHLLLKELTLAVEPGEGLLLDEATSALDASNEERLNGQLVGLSITPISVSHHQAIVKHHHWVP